MELAYVHDWVAFPTVQIQEMPVKLRVRVLSCIMQKAWAAFPLPRCMMCCKVRSVGCAKLSWLSIESAHFNFSFLIRFQKERKKPSTRERERERERETDRKTNRQTDRQTDRERLESELGGSVVRT